MNYDKKVEFVDAALRGANIQSNTMLADAIIQVVELVESKRGEVTLSELIKIQTDIHVKYKDSGQLNQPDGNDTIPGQ